MRLLVKSSKRVVEMHSSIYNKLSDDQKRAYQVLDRKDTEVPAEQIVVNEIGKAKKK